MRRGLRSLTGAAMALMICGSAQAVPITGGSSLLTGTYAGQLETWLGEGPIALTNIFSKAAVDRAQDWHAAVDGRGRTFSVIEVLPGRFSIFTDEGWRYVTTTESIIIGGYNPQSWRSDGTYSVTLDDADRTAFIFNLTDGIKQDQNSIGEGNGASGQFQTYNSATAGPVFGRLDVSFNLLDSDLWVDANLYAGRTGNYSYGGGPLASDIMNLGGSATTDLLFGRIETFLIADPLPSADIPEPSTLALICAGLFGFAFLRRRAPA